ncbi:MAG: YdbH domain-containing protein [Marinobacter sp.]|nr:YdbH domain-containing protein [Marinobacter sp.]
MPCDGLLPWKSRACLTVLLMCAVITQPVLAMNWSLMLQQGQFGLALPDVHSGGWSFIGLHADVVTAVDADNDVARIRFKPGSRLRAARIVQDTADEGLQLDDVRVDLTDVTLTVGLGTPGTLPERSSITGHMAVDIGALHHPRLKSLGWQLDGTVSGPLTDVRVNGQLRSDSGLAAEVTARHRVGAFLVANVMMALGGERGTKAMAATFVDWPGALQLNAGRIQAEARVHQTPDQPLALHGQFDFDGVGGLIDRTAVSGLNGRLLLSLEQDALVARARDVVIGQVNSGIGIGPVRLLAEYRAPRAELAAGVLDIQQATAGFLDGRLRVAPGSFDLARQPWRLPIDVYEVSLAKLLQVYPTEGLAGSGTLSGRVPLKVSGSGVEVEQGRVSAMAPGGLLRLPAERLQAMLGSSQAMELVVEALQNFHYSVLDSTIDYDNTGKLVLGLRLEGENPDVRGGQPVVLNINLEEDIPALLTSLQLSGRVNEAVTERVRERLQQSGQKSGQETVP